MDKVLSYPKIETPYQSCWLIIAKTLIINRISLSAVLKGIDVNGGSAIASSLGRHHEKLLLDLNKRLQLSALTLKQSCISSNFHSPSQARAQTIRHCQDCITQNFHSSLFQNPLLEKCPVHHKVLTYCRDCTVALIKGGSLYTKPLNKSNSCEHLRSLALERIPIVKLPLDEIRAFKIIGDVYQAWLEDIERLDLGDVCKVISKISGVRDLEISEFYFEYVRGRVGLPFDLYWQDNNFSHDVCVVNYAPAAIGIDNLNAQDASTCKFSIGKLPSNQRPSFNVRDVVSCLKCMRRHFFKEYIRQHRKCFNTMKSLSHSQLNVLSLSASCTCVSAYCSWLVSSGGVSTFPEYQALRSSLPMIEAFSDLLSQDAASLREALVTQLVSFFDIWGALGRASAKQNKCSGLIVKRATIPTQFFVCMNASYTLTHRDEASGHTQKEKSYIISPLQLKAQSQARCSSNKMNAYSRLFQLPAHNVFVRNAHGVMRFVDGQCNLHNTAVISIW